MYKDGELIYLSFYSLEYHKLLYNANILAINSFFYIIRIFQFLSTHPSQKE